MVLVEYFLYNLFIFIGTQYLWYFFTVIVPWVICSVVIMVLIIRCLVKITDFQNIKKSFTTSETFSLIPNFRTNFGTTYESAEWLNSIVTDIWNSEKKTIDNKIQSYLPYRISKNVTLLKLDLGNQQTLRIENIKAMRLLRYSSTLDLQISFNTNCYVLLMASIIKIELKNFKLFGYLRIVFRPKFNQKSIKIYFLNTPSFDFDAVGISALFKTKIKENIMDFICQNLLTPYEINLF